VLVYHYSHIALESPSAQCHVAYSGTPVPLILPCTMAQFQCCMIEPARAIYHSLAKEGPLMNECPSPTFGPISCMGSKFTQMSTHLEASFVWSLKSKTTSTLCIWSKQLCVIP